MKEFLFIITACLILGSCENKTKPTSASYNLCYFADLISDDESPNNQASPLEICISSAGDNRRLRLFDSEEVVTEIVIPPTESVRERMYICTDYFLLSEGSDAVNVLGHYYDNTIYRIKDGKMMTSFSSLDLVKNDCSIFKS